MTDHQAFTKEILPNGITLYSYQGSFATAHVEILLPIGAAHSHADNGFLPGSAHFLEHAQLIRSICYPEPYGLDYQIGLVGGHADATTYARWTSHWLDVPADHASFAYEALVDRVANPIFTEDDFVAERGVIRNERNRRSFYPGASQLSQHYYTQFLRDQSYPLEQLFGSDADLAATTPERLAAVHGRSIASPKIVALAVGPDDPKGFRERLALLPTQSKAPLQEKLQPTVWANRAYSKAYLESVPQPTLKVSWLHPRLSLEGARTASFLVAFLMNSAHGPLYREFREERGWSYGLDGFFSQREHASLISFSFPVNELSQVAHIRQHLPGLIHKALWDQQTVEYEITRQLNSRVYRYQTARDIISAASRSLMGYGRIGTEEEWEAGIRQMADRSWRLAQAEMLFAPETMGEICYLPERRKMVPARELARAAR